MVRILAVSLTEELPFVLVEKGPKESRVLDRGIYTAEKYGLAKTAHKTIVEIEGARFLSLPEYQDLGTGETEGDIKAFVGSGSEADFVLKRVSKSLFVSVRKTQLDEVAKRLEVIGVKPTLIAPKGLGITAALKRNGNEGLTVLDGREEAFVFKNGDLVYFRERGVAAKGLIQKRFDVPINPAPIEINSLDLPDAEPQFQSLLCLALFSKVEEEPFNFADNKQIEESLEPLKMRRSVIVAAVICLSLLIFPVILGLRVSGINKQEEKVTLKYSNVKKKVKRVKGFEKEAKKYFQDLIRISGSSSGQGFKSVSLSEIASATPNSIALTSLTEDGRMGAQKGGFKLSGYTKDMGDVFQFEANLKKGAFKETKVIDSRKAKRSGREVVIFRMAVK